MAGKQLLLASQIKPVRLGPISVPIATLV